MRKGFAMDMNITTAAALSQTDALRVAGLAAPATAPSTHSAGSAPVGVNSGVSSGTNSFAAVLASTANTANPVNTAPAPNIAITPSWLTDARSALAARPSVKQFTNATGLDASDARELITGVVSPNTDTRNWKAIMASDDPVQAARDATAKMFSRADPARKPTANTGAGSVVSRSGNFVLIANPRSPGSASIGIVDASGKLLRNAGSTPQSIAYAAWLYGIDTDALVNLQFSASRVSPKIGDAVAKAMYTQPANFLNTSAYLASLQKAA